MELEDRDLFLNLDSDADGEEVKSNSIAVGRISIDKKLNRNGTLAQIRSIWSPVEVLVIRSFDENLFGIYFANRASMEKAIDNSPYGIQNYNFILKEWMPGVAVEEISFDQICMWIQIHKLPRDMMTMRNLQMIGGRIGVMQDSEDPFADGLGRGFARIKVAMDVRKPMVKELQSRRTSGEIIKMSLRYENLQDICYCCGRIGHSFKSCNEYMVKPELRFDKSIKTFPIRSILPARKLTDDALKSKANEASSSSKHKMKGKDIMLIEITRVEDLEDKNMATKDISWIESINGRETMNTEIDVSYNGELDQVRKIVCLMKKPLTFHDNGARAEYMDHRKFEDDLIRKKLDKMDKDWHDMIADPKLDENIAQVSLFPSNTVINGQAYKVDFPEEEGISCSPTLPKLPSSSEFFLSTAFNNLVLKRKDYEGREKEILEDENFCGKLLNKGSVDNNFLIEYEKSGEKDICMINDNSDMRGNPVNSQSTDFGSDKGDKRVKTVKFVKNETNKKADTMLCEQEENAEIRKVLEDKTNCFEIGANSKGKPKRKYTRKINKKLAGKDDNANEGCGGWPEAVTKGLC